MDATVFSDPLVALEEMEWLVATTNKTYCIYKTRKGYKVQNATRYFPSERVVAVLNCRNVNGENVLNASRGKNKTRNIVKTVRKKEANKQKD